MLLVVNALMWALGESRINGIDAPVHSDSDLQPNQHE